MTNDIKILRALAREFITAAREPRNEERRRLHTAVNDLKMIRPVVLIDEVPWEQMNDDGSLSCVCEDKFFRDYEWHFRRSLYQYRRFPADMYLKPTLGVGKVVHSTGCGLGFQEDILKSEHKTSIVSHSYIDQTPNEAALEKIHLPVLTYDEPATLANWNKLGEAIGDIIPVKIVGQGYVYFATWDDISRYHGPHNCLIDLADRPEFIHALVKKITAVKMADVEQREALGLFDDENDNLHCTPSLVSDLPGEITDGKITRKNIWGRGMAQIFGSVSREMHEEFDIDYMKDTIGTFGLSYYGCCEPLHNKVDIVAKIPNLRKIGCTPWADADAEAEAVDKRFVLSLKPNPATVASPTLDHDNLRKELKKMLDAAHRYGCSCDITLKDISTSAHRPENLFEWEQIAMEMALNY